MFVPCHPKNGHVFRLEGHPKLKCKTYNFENNFDLNSHLAFSLSGYCSCSYHFYEEGPYLDKAATSTAKSLATLLYITLLLATLLYP